MPDPDALNAEALLVLVQADHRPVRVGQGVICSAGCGSHPCETYRIADGHLGWPNCHNHTIAAPVPG